MSCRSDEEDDAAPLQASFTTPTKAIRNDGAGHGEPDTEETDAESGSDVEKNSTSRRAISNERCFRHLVEMVAFTAIQASLFSTTIFAYVLCAIMTPFRTDYLQQSLK